MTEKTPTGLKAAMAAARRVATGLTPPGPQPAAKAVGTEPQGVKAVGTPGPEPLIPHGTPVAIAAAGTEPIPTPMPPGVHEIQLRRVSVARIAIGPAVRTQVILDAWLGDVDDDSVLHPDGPEAARWFGTDLALDREISERFSLDLSMAAASGPRDTGPHQTLAHIILLDPIARRIHRDTPEMYATDALARGYCLHALKRKHHRTLSLPERLMLVLPLMHAERTALQDAAVRYLEHLCALALDRCPGSTLYRHVLERARLQQQIIARFGRFPHRNHILGRASTNDELDFIGR